MKTMLKTLALLAVTLALPAAAAAGEDTITIVDNGFTATKACNDHATVSIAGNDLKLTLTGMCGVVEIAGNDNTIIIDGAESISVPGNQNVVTWKRGPGGKDPKIAVVGNGNKVAKAAPKKK